MRTPFLLALSLLAVACSAAPPESEADIHGSPQAAGPERPVQSEIDVPGGPVELDPDVWALCDAPDGYTEVDPTTLLGDPAAWDGAKVAVEGMHSMTWLFSLAMCPPFADCCDRVFDTHFLIGHAGAGNGVEDNVYLEGIGCSSGHRRCPCFEVIPLGPRLVWGTVHLVDDRVTIQVVDHCATGPNPREPDALRTP
jgi:hypothetical protein